MVSSVLTRAISRWQSVLMDDINKTKAQLVAELVALRQRVAALEATHTVRQQAHIEGITERQRLEQELVAISEQEHQRLGEDLHDGLGQHLMGIALLGKQIEERLGARPSPEAALVAQLNRLLKEAITRTRHLARGFYPVALECDGLIAALNLLAENAHSVFGVQVQVTAEVQWSWLDSSMGIHLYRIAQEAVANAIHHGQAQRVVINLTGEPHSVMLCIDDDGVGIPDPIAEGHGLGIRLMRHRARVIGAALEITHLAQGGTRVTCRLPGLPIP